MKRTIKKQFWFSRDEAQDLQKKAKKACLPEAALVRLLLRGYEPKEKPDDRFYDMASKYGFNREQREYLDELLSDENNSLWSSVLYGTSGEDNQIVAVALSQVGNVGGRPYWSWYGFNSRVEWCACFVSWCANECGYIETGIIPKYASCVNGVQWFKDRGQWLDGSAEPLPGMIIFYDWDKQGQSGQQDGRADHTGIVWKVENGYVYTIEGNLSDKCMTSRRPIGEYQILGYGVPEY